MRITTYFALIFLLSMPYGVQAGSQSATGVSGYDQIQPDDYQGNGQGLAEIEINFFLPVGPAYANGDLILATNKGQMTFHYNSAGNLNRFEEHASYFDDDVTNPNGIAIAVYSYQGTSPPSSTPPDSTQLADFIQVSSYQMPGESPVAVDWRWEITVRREVGATIREEKSVSVYFPDAELLTHHVTIDVESDTDNVYTVHYVDENGNTFDNGPTSGDTVNNFGIEAHITENVDWTVEIRDSNGNVIETVTGRHDPSGDPPAGDVEIVPVFLDWVAEPSPEPTPPPAADPYNSDIYDPISDPSVDIGINPNVPVPVRPLPGTDEEDLYNAMYAALMDAGNQTVGYVPAPDGSILVADEFDIDEEEGFISGVQSGASDTHAKALASETAMTNFADDIVDWLGLPTSVGENLNWGGTSLTLPWGATFNANFDLSPYASYLSIFRAIMLAVLVFIFAFSVIDLITGKS